MNIRDHLKKLQDSVRDVEEILGSAQATADFGINQEGKTKSKDPGLQPIMMRLFPRGLSRDPADSMDAVVRVVLDAGDCLALSDWAERATLNLDEEDVVCLEIRGSMVVDDDDVQRFVRLVKRMAVPRG